MAAAAAAAAAAVLDLAQLSATDFGVDRRAYSEKEVCLYAVAVGVQPPPRNSS